MYSGSDQRVTTVARQDHYGLLEGTTIDLDLVSS